MLLRRPALILLLAVSTIGRPDGRQGRAAATAAIKGGTDRQIRDLLTDLQIAVPSDASRDALLARALQPDVLDGHETVWAGSRFRHDKDLMEAAWEDDTDGRRPQRHREWGVEVATKMMGRMDKNGDGVLSPSEQTLKSVGKGGSGFGREDLEAMDEDGDSTVTLNEAKRYFTRMSEMMERAADPELEETDDGLPRHREEL